MKTIHVSVKINYGKEVIYPVCKSAHIFARIAGTKTLTRETLRSVNELGYTVEVKQPELSL